MKDPKPVLAKPAMKKEIPNSFFPKLEAVTKSPTNAKIAPKTQVSKALTTSLFTLTCFKYFVYPLN